jgi:hypothetical protein
MSVASNREIEVIVEDLARALIRNRASQHAAAQSGDHLYVAESRDMNIGIGPSNDLLERFR